MLVENIIQFKHEIERKNIHCVARARALIDTLNQLNFHKYSCRLHSESLRRMDRIDESQHGVSIDLGLRIRVIVASATDPKRID